jgi:hypothetical protein
MKWHALRCAKRAPTPQAQALHQKQMKEYGEQFAATDEVSKAREKANAVYMMYVKLARLAFEKDRYVYGSLQLNGRRNESHSGWLRQASTFYNHALEDKNIQTGLALMGITFEKLKAGQKLVKDFEIKLDKQIMESSQAQKATELRDQALDRMNDWMYKFIKVSRIALQDSPQDLEALGLTIKR